MANINRLAETGKLVLAGPFVDGGDRRGVFIFKVDSLGEAQALTDTDPAVIRRPAEDRPLPMVCAEGDASLSRNSAKSNFAAPGVFPLWRSIAVSVKSGRGGWRMRRQLFVMPTIERSGSILETDFLTLIRTGMLRPT
jgi:hypothetical protein